MIKLKTMLDELIVKDLTSGQKYKHFIAWKDKLFILDDNSDISSALEHLSHHPSKIDKNIDTLDDLLNVVMDMPEDVLSGTYNSNDRHLYIQGYKGNPITSVLLKKIIKQLRIKTVERTDVSDDDNIITKAHKTTGEIPKIGFHGTNTINLEKILRAGIDISKGEGNFTHNDVYHTEEIFFGATFDIAKFYANHSTYDHNNRSYDGVKKKSGAEPAIIEFKITDPSKIVPDFDADAITTKDKYYQHNVDQRDFSDMKSMGLSKEIGKFGYNGRILPTSFLWIYIYSQAEKKWKKFKPTTVKSGLDRWDSDWYYRAGIGEY